MDYISFYRPYIGLCGLIHRVYAYVNLHEPISGMIRSGPVRSGPKTNPVPNIRSGPVLKKNRFSKSGPVRLLFKIGPVRFDIVFLNFSGVHFFDIVFFFNFFGVHFFDIVCFQVFEGSTDLGRYLMLFLVKLPVECRQNHVWGCTFDQSYDHVY